MFETEHWSRRQVKVADPLGINMRAAEKLMKLAGSFESEIVVRHGNARANGKSILDLCTLAAECGVTIGIEARGPDADSATGALAELVATHVSEHGQA